MSVFVHHSPSLCGLWLGSLAVTYISNEQGCTAAADLLFFTLLILAPHSMHIVTMRDVFKGDNMYAPWLRLLKLPASTQEFALTFQVGKFSGGDFYTSECVGWQGWTQQSLCALVPSIRCQKFSTFFFSSWRFRVLCWLKVSLSSPVPFTLMLCFNFP